MSDLKSRYQQILKELENNIQDENERNFVITKFQELSVIFMDIIDRLTYVTDLRVKEVEEKQKEVENKLDSIQKAVDGIENDIYEDDESYEFEITCPYCNHDFVADINSDTNTEVECPECHNVIELDWNADEDEYENDCPHCNHDCIKNQALTYDAEEDTNPNKNDKGESIDYDEDIDENDEEDEDM